MLCFYQIRFILSGSNRLFWQTTSLRCYGTSTLKKEAGVQEKAYPYRSGNMLYNILPENLPEKCRKMDATSLITGKVPPRQVQMLVRDFIEDSLYNPFYGYYSKQACILSTPMPFEFSKMKNNNSFYKELSRIYAGCDKATTQEGIQYPKQLWHTPTELFKPYYGEAIARYLLAHYKLSYYPYDDLRIYEVGSGNGTLMFNILDYLRNVDPDVYTRTKYCAIEISHSLAAQQVKTLKSTKSYHEHQEKIEIVNKNIFDWNTLDPNPCFFILLEVLDNFPHDLIRYNPITQQPYQAIALIDEIGDIHEFYSPNLDPLIIKYLSIKKKITQEYNHRYKTFFYFLKRLKTLLPFSENLIDPEFIPTKQLILFDVLRNYFPQHKLIISDFSSLPEGIQGINAPLVQTRLSGITIPCSTYLVKQGKFLEHWGDTKITRTISGENPMLDWFENVKFLITQ
ncbi:hypothetical protein PMAC_002442 [Pneumocystis sp. 'macacae']|nr:hypothetical protein PMAC_002442 [Pneumocystis sp. 'macacae']